MGSNSMWHGFRAWWSGHLLGAEGVWDAQVQQLTKRLEDVAANNLAIAEQQRVIAHEVHAATTLALQKSQSSLREIGAKLDGLAALEARAERIQSLSATQQVISDVSQQIGTMANEVNAIHNAVLLQKQEVAALATAIQVRSPQLQTLSADLQSLIGDVGILAAQQETSGHANHAFSALSERLSQLVPAALDTQNGVLLNSLGAIEARAAARDGAMSNEVNAILNTTLPIFDRVNELDAKLVQLRHDVGAMRAFDTRHNMLMTRGMAALLQARPQQAKTFKHVAPALRVASLEEQMASFKKKAPANFAAWLAAYVAGIAEGERSSEGNLSHDGHEGAEYFRMFVNIHGVGRLLDVGCGPLAVPSYLADWPTTHLAGIDPQQPFSPHPFAFAQTFAETLPWPDGSFETVVIGTSLDHVYLLDQSLAEIKRVLTPHGRLLIWTGMFENSRAYDPYAAAYQAPDAYHLFHPGKNWFYDLFARDYRLMERLETVASAEFLAYERT